MVCWSRHCNIKPNHSSGSRGLLKAALGKGWHLSRDYCFTCTCRACTVSVTCMAWLRCITGLVVGTRNYTVWYAQCMTHGHRNKNAVHSARPSHSALGLCAWLSTRLSRWCFSELWLALLQPNQQRRVLVRQESGGPTLSSAVGCSMPSNTSSDYFGNAAVTRRTVGNGLTQRMQHIVIDLSS